MIVKLKSETERERAVKMQCHRYHEHVNKVAITSCLKKCATIDTVLHIASIFRIHL